MNSIRDFDSIPQVLKSILKSQSRRPLSIRQLSRKLGYASDRTLGMVVQGERIMGAEMLRRLAEFAKLSGKDKDYLALLALKQKQMRQGQPVEKIEKLIHEARGNAGVARKATGAQLHALTAWYAFTVIEVLGLFKVPVSVREIQKKLRGTVALTDIEKTLEALAELNYIHRSESGHYRALAENEYLATPVDIPSLTVRQIHRQQLERAIETLNQQSVHEREFIAKTFTVSESQIAAFKVRVREVMEELAEQFVSPHAEDGVVIQLNQQLYQQTEPLKRGSE